VPLCLADFSTKVVLAGDHMQLDPPVYSDIARKYNLHLSLLERLFDAEVYESELGRLCKTVLTENHRSHQLVGPPSCGMCALCQRSGDLVVSDHGPAISAFL